MGKNEYAPLWSRVLAHNIDLLILLLPAYGSSIFITENHFFYPLWTILYLIYHCGMEIGPWQGSIGKKALKIRVLTDEYAPQSLKKTLIRNFGKILSILLLFSGVLMISFNPKKQGLHDKLARSVLTIN